MPVTTAAQQDKHGRCRAAAFPAERDWPLLLMTLPAIVLLLRLPLRAAARQRHRLPGLRPLRRASDGQPVGRAVATSSGCSPTRASGTRCSNTLSITAFQLVLFFPLPIALALLLNSVVVRRAARCSSRASCTCRTSSRWVLVVTLFQQMLGGAGLLAQILRDHGFERLGPHDQPGHVHPAGHRAGGLEGRRLGDDHLPRRAGRHQPEPLRGRRRRTAPAAGGGCGTSRCPACAR